MPIFQHKHRNVSPFVSLVARKSLSLVSHQGLDACSEQQVPPFLSVSKKGETEFDLFHLCCFYQMSGEILDTGVLLSDEKVIDFRVQTI